MNSGKANLGPDNKCHELHIQVPFPLSFLLSWGHRTALTARKHGAQACN